MTTLAIIITVALVSMLAAGLGAYFGAMLAAGTIAIKITEVRDNANDRTGPRKPTNSIP